MKSTERCIHGSSPAKKVCYSKDCNQCAFTSMACEQCEVEHDHGGHLTYQNRTAVWTEVETLLARRPNKQKMDKLCESANTVAEELSQICEEVVGDFEKVITKLEVKPQLRRTIQRFKSNDVKLKGQELSALCQALATKNLFAKDDSAHSKVNSLKHLYHDFLEELQQSVETFKKQKAEILERKVANDKKVLKEQPNPKMETVQTKAPSRPTKVVSSSSVVYVRPSQPVVKLVPSTIKHIRHVRIPGSNKYFDNVADIKPNEEKLNLLVKVLWTKSDKSGSRNLVRCMLGDETGCVEGCFDADKEKLVKAGAVLEFNAVRAYVYQGSIMIQIYHSNSISLSKLEVANVNESLNISEMRF